MPASNDEGAGAPAATPKRHRARLPPARKSAGRGGSTSIGRSPAGRGRTAGAGAGRRPAGTGANGGGGNQSRSTGTGSASGSSSTTLGSAALRESSAGGTSGTNTSRSPNRQQSQARRPGPGRGGGRGNGGGGRSSVRGGGGRGGRAPSTPTRGPSRRPGSGNRSMHASRSSHGHNGSVSALRDPVTLYRLLESGLDKGKGTAGGGGKGARSRQQGGEQEAKPMTRLEEIQRAERLDKMYDAVREWLRSNSSNPADMPSSPASSASPPPADPALKHAAATHLGQFGMTPLHLLCKLPNPPVDIVADLIETAPETLQWAESSGWLPIHLAVASGASLAVLEMLCDAHPDGKIAQDRRLRTPLHFAFFRDDVRASKEGMNKAHLSGGSDFDVTERGYDSDWDDLDVGTGDDADIVDLLSDSGAALQHDENGMLPLHYASAYGTSTGVLDALFEAYPNSIRARERNGRTPLHLAMVNAHRPASPAVIRFLLSIPDTDVVNMKDKEGNLPLHLLANVADRIRSDEKEVCAYATESLKLYLAAGPKASSEFLTAVQRLPSWLQDHAVVSPHVQSVLNVKIAKRFPTSILLLDGYVLIMLIVCFEIASNYTIDVRFQEEGDPPVEPFRGPGFAYAVIAGGGYFFVREVIQAFALVNIGSFTSWIFSPSNWLDLFMMALVLTMGAAMINIDIMSRESFRNMAALAKGVLWVSFILYVKSTLVDFAVFVGGVQYVLRRLAAFLVVLSCILVAFGFMFYYVFLATPFCVKDEEQGFAFPHCTISDSLLRVYTMMMGEVDDTVYQTTVSQALYILYAFLVIILLSNVLIAIVTDSYGVIKNERAAMVFWSNRLNFIAEVDAIATVRKQLLGEGNICPRPWSTDVDATGNEVEGKSKSKKVFRDLWNTLASLFEENPYEYMDVSPGSFDFWCYLLLRIVAIFIIPVWLILGLVTAGWLWPPQIRERLLCQTNVRISRADIAIKAKKEISKLRHELRNLKREVLHEKKVEKREVIKMKSDVEELKSSVLSDLTQIREIMTTLLELEREKAQR